MPRVSPAPRPMRICEVDLNTVDSLCLIFAFGLEDELLEDGIRASDNTVFRIV